MSNSTQPDTRPAAPPQRPPNGPSRWLSWLIAVAAGLTGVLILVVAADLVPEAPEVPDTSVPREPPKEPVEPLPEPPTVDRWLYSHESLSRYRSAMSTPGPYFAWGDAGHGGGFSPGDGEAALELAEEFLADPAASYWSQPELPYSAGDPYPSGLTHVRPMHAAWVYMTEPERPDRDTIAGELKKLLLAHAGDPSLDFGDAANYPVDFPGEAQNPIFQHAQWMTRMVKTRDMLGRELLSDEQNATFDRWIFGYANWSASWLQLEVYGDMLPGRTERDYSDIGWSENADRISYDDGPPIGRAGMAYTNRHAAVASAMSIAVNYLAHHGHDGSTTSEPEYGTMSVDEVLEQSRLFVEETLRFSVWPQGFQGDFERGNRDFHDSSAQQGWLYSINVLANLLEIAEYHAKRGDMSVWEYGTVEGHDGSAGVPVAGGFEAKDLHFFAWAMSRYVNGEWGRTNYGEPLALPSFYHDVIPAAMAHRFAREDVLLEAAWKREGQGFPPYPESPQSQGTFDATFGEGAKMIGLIEHAIASDLQP